jgi:hypothetical protein
MSLYSKKTPYQKAWIPCPMCPSSLPPEYISKSRMDLKSNTFFKKNFTFTRNLAVYFKSSQSCTSKMEVIRRAHFKIDEACNSLPILVYIKFSLLVTYLNNNVLSNKILPKIDDNQV